MPALSLYSRRTALCLVAWFVLVAAAFGDDRKISPDLKPLLANTTTKIKVIVQYYEPPTTCTSGGLLGGLLCTGVNLLGGVLDVVFDVINGVTAILLPGDIIKLSA